MMVFVEVVSRPTVRSMAEPIVGQEPNALPHNETSLRAALIAETIRIGLFDLYHRSDPGTPVHPLSLRSWVRHKLQPIIPDVLDEGESSFREVLCEGRGANLEFLGDALNLTNGYLCPAPTRLVKVSPTTHLLVSGVPSHCLGWLSGRLVHGALGRRIVGLTDEESASLEVPTQRLEEYLGRPEGLLSPETLVKSLLVRSHKPWQPGKGWEAYVGNLEIGVARSAGSYGFNWTDPNEARARRFAQTDVDRTIISLWREPLTERFYHYWISGRTKEGSFGIAIANTEWKQVCLALDALAGRPREATFVRGANRPGLVLSLSFQPFEALYRVLHALDGRFSGWRAGTAQWELPPDAKDPVSHLLEQVGVKVRMLGS